MVAYNIARGIYYRSEWVFGGQNLSAWRLPLADWVVAMNACDATITVGAGTEPAFRCGAEVSVDLEPLSVMEQIGLAGNMRFSEVGGRLRPLVGLPGAPVFVFSDDDLVVTDGQDLRPFAPLSQTFNNGVATYPEPEQRWKAKVTPEVRLTDWYERDGQDLPMAITFGAAPFKNQVQRLLRSQLNDAQRTAVHEITLPPQAYGLEPLDLVTWNSTRNGYVTKNFLVLAVSKLPGMNVRVAIRETNPADYSWSPEFLLPSEVVPVLAAPRPRQTVADFTANGVTILDSDSRARVSAVQVTCSGDLAGVQQLQVRVLPIGSSTPVVDQTFPFETPHVWLITGVAPKTSYRVLVRPVSTYAAGVWSSEIVVTTPDLKVPASGLAPDVFDLISDTAELAGVKPVSTLPATGDKVDQIVMLVPPGRLYRWTGSAWTSNLFAGVEAGSLDIAAFAANIRPPELFATLPTTGNSDGRTVYRTSDNTMWQRRAGAWVNLNAAELIVGQLVAGQIAAGAIGATQIAAKAIVASKMAIGDTSNIFPDPLLVDFPNEWIWTTPADYNADVATVIANTVDASPSEKEIRLAVAGVATTGGANSPAFSIEAGQNYYFSLFLGALSSGGITANCTTRFYVRWYSDTAGAGANIISSILVDESVATYSALTAPRSGILVAPANAKSARLYAQRVGDATKDAMTFSGPVVRRANAGELTVDGSITADHLAAGSVVADKIAAGAIVASKIAAGAVSVDKLTAGQIIAESMIVDGAVSKQYYMYWSGQNTFTSTTAATLGVGVQAGVAFAARVGNQNPVIVTFNCMLYSAGSGQAKFILQRWDGTAWVTHDAAFGALNYSAGYSYPVFRYTDAAWYGGVSITDGTYRLQTKKSASGDANYSVGQMMVSFQQVNK